MILNIRHGCGVLKCSEGLTSQAYCEDFRLPGQGDAKDVTIGVE